MLGYSKEGLVPEYMENGTAKKSTLGNIIMLQWTKDFYGHRKLLRGFIYYTHTG
jgi:hypothetical protein